MKTPDYFDTIVGLLKKMNNDLLVIDSKYKPIGILSKEENWTFEPFGENQYEDTNAFEKETGRRLGMLDPDGVFIMQSEFELVKSLVKGNISCWEKHKYVYLEELEL